MHRTEYAISSANLLFSYISIAGLSFDADVLRILRRVRDEQPRWVFLSSRFTAPLPHIGIARVQESSCPSSARPQISSLFDVSSCASTKFAVKLEAFITRARKRTRPPSENENNRKRNKLVEISSRISPSNPRYRCSLIFLSFLSLFSFSTFKDCDCVRGSSSREQRPSHRRLVYFSWQMFRGRWKEGIRVAKFIPVFFPPSARNTVLYIYICLGGEIKMRVFNLIIAFTKRNFEEDKPLIITPLKKQT